MFYRAALLMPCSSSHALRSCTSIDAACSRPICASRQWFATTRGSFPSLGLGSSCFLLAGSKQGSFFRAATMANESSQLAPTLGGSRVEEAEDTHERIKLHSDVGICDGKPELEGICETEEPGFYEEGLLEKEQLKPLNEVENGICKTADGSLQVVENAKDVETVGIAEGHANVASAAADDGCEKKPKRKLLLETEHIVWPPTVIIENARVKKGDDGRWTGIGNTEMAYILRGIGHTEGRPKAAYGKEGHRGQVLVGYSPTPAGLQEALRLHEHFVECKRGHEEWLRVKPFWHGLPGMEGIGEEGPDFVRIDKDDNTEKRVLYGYLATHNDLVKFPWTQKKRSKRPKTISMNQVEAAFANSPNAVFTPH